MKELDEFGRGRYLVNNCCNKVKVEDNNETSGIDRTIIIGRIRLDTSW